MVGLLILGKGKECGSERHTGTRICHIAQEIPARVPFSAPVFLPLKPDNKYGMMNTRRTDIALLLLRLMFGGGMIIGHGWSKLMKFFGEEPLSFANPYGIGEVPSLVLATGAEFFCSILIVLGLFTRLAALPLIFTMLTVVLVVNFGEPFAKTEKAWMYLIPYICLALTGAGYYSLDGWRLRRRAA